MTSRRHFLRSAARSAALTSLASLAAARPARAMSFLDAHPGVDPAAGPNDPVLRELAMRALDAARAAGATYADVRLTADRTQSVSSSGASEAGRVYAGVRALVGGFWGFASSTDYTPDSMARLAREAVAQAKVNDWGTTRVVTLDDAPPTATGAWRTPAERDPFAVSVEEKVDFLQGVLGTPEVLGLPYASVSLSLEFRRQDKVFAATSGAYLAQTLFWTGPTSVQVTAADPETDAQTSVSAPAVPLQSGGYELLPAARIHERIAGWADDARRLWNARPAQIGRYDFVFDASTMAAIVRSTFGYATELDRVRGYETNAGGTSYLTEEALGTRVAAQGVTITASRSTPRGPATVQWDDDGVAPEPFPLVKDGTLVDFATSREHAPALAAWYRRVGQPVRSHGCATANDASGVPLVTPPDLTLEPAPGGPSFDELVADTREGVAVVRGECAMDRQQRTGQGGGTLFEIRNGKLGAYLGRTPIFLFKSSELWNNVVALGGPSSAASCGYVSSKGEPAQSAPHGVTAVPAKVRNITLLDPWRT